MLLIRLNRYWIIGLYGNVSYQTRIAYLREKLVIVPVSVREYVFYVFFRFQKKHERNWLLFQ